MSKTLQLLGGLTVKQFLDEYWQKKPLLIRNAIPDFQSPLSADELAGLACEDEVESRLILEKDGPTPWSVEHGPFDETRFLSLPESHWTLLVQGVNTWVPEVAELIEPFRFIPDWRIDDIMISYAPKHGSVGPHLDQYDVFLIQAEGHRHWQINTQAYSKEDCIPDISLSILKNFESDQEWTLAPGDMLYLPPNVAHYGVAQDDCITYSLGFRAPAESELISSFIDDLLPQYNETHRYNDGDLQQQVNPGEISPQALNKIQNHIRLDNISDETINHWFGRYITEPKNPLSEENEHSYTEHDLEHLLSQNSSIYRHPISRFAYIKIDNGCVLFTNGEEYSATCELASYLCASFDYSAKYLVKLISNPITRSVLTELINKNLIVCE